MVNNGFRGISVFAGKLSVTWPKIWPSPDGKRTSPINRTRDNTKFEPKDVTFLQISWFLYGYGWPGARDPCRGKLQTHSARLGCYIVLLKHSSSSWKWISSRYRGLCRTVEAVELELFLTSGIQEEKEEKRFIKVTVMRRCLKTALVPPG